MNKKKKIIEVNSTSEIPRFTSENEERKYWETHFISDELYEQLYDPKIDKRERDLTKRLKMTDRRKQG